MTELETASDLVLAVDASTTACKALVFDATGRVLAEGRGALELFNPEPDGYEQDAEHWWTATVSAIQQATQQLGDAAKRVRAVCLTHQRETFVLTDRRARPIHPALVWMDARCRDEVSQAKEQLGADTLHRLTGKPASTTPSFYKLAYVLNRQPASLSRDLRVLDVGAFLSWRLTGRCATSLASADPLGLVDMQRRDWADELLGYLRLSRANMPELVPAGEVLGHLDSDVARTLGLEALPLVAGAGDGQAAGLGAGIVGPGRAYLNLGTAIVSGVLAREYRTHPAFRTLYGAAPGTYFLETDLKGGTFTLNWLCEKWLANGAAPSASLETLLGELESQAAQLPPGADGLVLVPYWNGVMNPYWDDDATGITLGWHGAHGPAHLYRAFLEGIAFEQRLHSRGVELATESIQEFVVMGGGAKSPLWCQILADVLERKIVRSATHEASALGAAMLASVAAGLFPSVESAARAMARTSDVFTSGTQQGFYARFFDEVYVGLYPQLRDALHALAQLRTQSRVLSSSK